MHEKPKTPFSFRTLLREMFPQFTELNQPAHAANRDFSATLKLTERSPLSEWTRTFSRLDLETTFYHTKSGLTLGEHWCKDTGGPYHYAAKPSSPHFNYWEAAALFNRLHERTAPHIERLHRDLKSFTDDLRIGIEKEKISSARVLPPTEARANFLQHFSCPLSNSMRLSQAECGLYTILTLSNRHTMPPNFEIVVLGPEFLGQRVRERGSALTNKCAEPLVAAIEHIATTTKHN